MRLIARALLRISENCTAEALRYPIPLFADSLPRHSTTYFIGSILFPIFLYTSLLCIPWIELTKETNVISYAPWEISFKNLLIKRSALLPLKFFTQKSALIVETYFMYCTCKISWCKKQLPNKQVLTEDCGNLYRGGGGGGVHFICKFAEHGR